MRCRTCLIALRGPFKKIQQHHIDKRQCARCHYFGIRGTVKRTYRDFPVRGEIGHEKKNIIFRPITKQNVELYCKLKQIVVGRKCNKEVILSNSKNKRYAKLYEALKDG